MNKKDFAWLIMCSRKTIAYVADMDSYELKFLSPAAMELCGLTTHEEYLNQKCYELIQDLDAPCAFCTNRKLRPGEPYKWEFYNQHLKCWASIEDSLIDIDGRSYRLEVIQDISKNKAKIDSILNQLTMEEMLVKCIELLAYENDADVAIDRFLETVGDFYAADRAYIVEYDFEQGCANNTYEWCQRHISSEKDNLQKLPLELLKDWDAKFENRGFFYINSVRKDYAQDSPEYNILNQQGIQSVAAAPFVQDGQITGFLGVDNPSANTRDWTLLRSVSTFVIDELKKRRLFLDLEYASYRDLLTGLNNRNYYQKFLDELKLSPPGSLGIVYIDINGLKAANDSYGHQYGDYIITQSALILKRFFPDCAFRIGGDEFIALSIDCGQADFEQRVADVKESFAQDKNVDVSIGSLWKQGEYNIENEIILADELMYSEKQKYYDEILREGRASRTGQATHLLQAIRNHQFAVVYKPQVELATGKIVGVEDLIRKKGPGGKLITPDHFITRYESEGIIRHIDLYVFEVLCAQLKKWHDRGDKLRGSVNFSRVTLMETNIVKTLQDVCARYSVSPEDITVEITESISKLENAALNALINTFHAAGFSISLDDFGTAYSNLSILGELDFTELKIDKSMLQDLTDNKKKQALVKNVILICKDFGNIISLAEGIESEEQYALLLKYHCLLGQGYFFSKPLTEKVFNTYYRTKKTLRAPMYPH